MYHKDSLRRQPLEHPSRGCKPTQEIHPESLLTHGEQRGSPEYVGHANRLGVKPRGTRLALSVDHTAVIGIDNGAVSLAEGLYS